MEDELVFPEGYFEAEEREGFLVEGMMKRAWAAQLVILHEIDRICKKHEIHWFADWGTLLGAARHRGFVPWDDDIDICMKRIDYQKFIQAAESELPDGWHLVRPQSVEEYDNPFMRVVNSYEISFTEERAAEFYGFPYVAGIDIFPLDALPQDEREREVLQELLVILRGALTMTAGEEREALLRQIEELLNIQIDRNGNVQQQILVLFDNMGRLYSEEEAEEYAEMAAYIDHKEAHLPKEWYRETVWLPFENISLPCPVDYEKVLEAEYGDWKKLVQGTSDHEYPFYKKQMKTVEEYLKAKEKNR